jgi:Zn-dependent protease
VAGTTPGDGPSQDPAYQQPQQPPPPQQGEPGQQGQQAQRRRDPRQGIVIAKVFGIPVYISPYWFFVAALLTYLYAHELDSNIQPVHVRYLVSAAFVVLLYASVLVHELSHCVVARAFRLPVRRVLLYPLGGFSEIEQEPPTPSQEFLVSVAGPVLSLVLAGLAALLTKVVPDGLPNLLIDQLFRANLLVGLFNLLPGLPLDGGRIFRAGWWKVTGKAVGSTIAAAWAGRVLAVALILVPIAIYGGQFQALLNGSYWLWGVFIAAFMWMQSGQAIRAAKVRERLPTLEARRLARRAIPIPANVPLAEAIRRADEAQARALVVVDHAATPIAIVNEEAVMATPPQRRPWVEVGALARTLAPGMVLSADLSGMALIEAVRAVPASEYLLIEPSGQVYGVLATTDLDHAFAGV